MLTAALLMIVAVASAGVERMSALFKESLNDADIPDIVDYLVKRYGNEQSKQFIRCTLLAALQPFMAERSIR